MTWRMMALVLETLIWKMMVAVNFVWMRFYLRHGHYHNKDSDKILDFFDCLELQPGDLVNGFAFRDADLEDNGDDDLELSLGECGELDLDLDLFLGMGKIDVDQDLFLDLFFCFLFTGDSSTKSPSF